MKRALCIKCSVILSRHAPSSFSSSKLLTTTLPGSPQIGKRTMTAMNWSGCNGHGMAAHGGQAFAFLVSSLARRRRPPVALMTKKTVGGISEFPPPNKTSSFSSSRLVLRLDRRHRALLQRRPQHRRFCARAPICPLSPHLHPFYPARSALANNGHSICRRLFRGPGHFGGSSPPPPLALTR